MERTGGTTRIRIGINRLGGGLAPLIWLGVPLAFAFFGYQINPFAGLVAGGMAAVFVLMLLWLGRLASSDEEAGAVCYNDERVWIERPELKTPAFVDATRSAVEQFAGVDFPDPRPVLESLPLGAVEQIRVDTCSSPSEEQGATPHARLSIEAEAGRLEYTLKQHERSKLD